MKIAVLILPLVSVLPIAAASLRPLARLGACLAAAALVAAVGVVAAVSPLVIAANIPLWVVAALVTFRLGGLPLESAAVTPAELDGLRRRRNEVREVVALAERDEGRALQIYGAAKALAESVTMEEMGPRLASAVQRLFDSYEFMLYAVDQGQPTLLQRRGVWKKEPPLAAFPTVPQVARPPAVGEIVPVLFAPIQARDGQLSGGLFVKIAPQPEREAESLKIAAELGPQLAMGLAKAQLFRQLELQSRLDGLTGTLRRQAFLDRLDQEFKRAAVFKSGFSLLMIDIDHFKNVNDTKGHAAGDAVLARVGALLTESLYETDVVGRYGGEEFIVLLPRSEAAGVSRKAEALRQRIERETIAAGLSTVRVTVSVGVARYPESGMTAAALIEAADRALYRAKESGRNRIVST
jgi:diguanylate cyclase (GGDEF)-like protein